MAAESNALVLTNGTSCLVKKASVEKAVTPVDPVIDSEGAVVDYDALDPIFTIEMEGEGDLPEALVAGAGLPEGNLDIKILSGVATAGVTIIESTDEEQNHDKPNSWKSVAINAPSAVA